MLNGAQMAIDEANAAGAYGGKFYVVVSGSIDHGAADVVADLNLHASIGYAEQLEYLDTVKGAELDAAGGRRAVTDLFEKTARAASDYYIDGYSARDGIHRHEA